MTLSAHHSLSIITALLLLSSCTKSKVDGDRRSPVTGTRMQLSLDSLYLYAQDTYLWNTALPNYDVFAPRQYAGSTTLTGLETALYHITSYATNTATGQSYEYRNGFSKPLYSYIAKGNIITGQQAGVGWGNTITGQQAGVGLNGAGDDMGLQLAVVNDTAVYVNLAEPGSPAAQAGITRGMRVLQVNGSPPSLKPLVLQDLLSSASLPLLLQRRDGTQLATTLMRSTYIASPLLAATTFTIRNKTVAYLALSRFGEVTQMTNVLQPVFNGWTGMPITNMIVDLRYNEGGYVETAAFVANLLAPVTAHGKVMYAEHYNTTMQAGKARILQAIPYLDAHRQRVYVNGRPATYADADYSVAGNTYHFNKKEGLTGLQSIVFIVSGRTASASELLINSLRPYVDVHLAGSTTYGKPVGFFGLPVDTYTMYLAQFHIVNAAGQGDYYTGLLPDMPAGDDITYNFGEAGENSTAAALQYIGESPYRLVTQPAMRVTHTTAGIRSFPGLIENRLRLK